MVFARVIGGVWPHGRRVAARRGGMLLVSVRHVPRGGNMDQKQSCHGLSCCVLPPYILENVARNAGSRAREAALRTLSIDTTLRNRRSAEQLLNMLKPRRRVRPATTPHKDRIVYTANNTQSLPGTVVRPEGGAASGDSAVDENHAGFGATYDFYWNVLQRSSVDDAERR